MSVAASAAVTARERRLLSLRGKVLWFPRSEELTAAFPVSGLPTTKDTFLLSVTPPGLARGLSCCGCVVDIRAIRI